jgi:hypothetical protein
MRATGCCCTRSRTSTSRTDSTFGPQTWHLQCRKHWLGCDDATLPTGETMSIPRSTADLSVDEFSDYMTAVEAWANARRNVYLDE